MVRARVIAWRTHVKVLQRDEFFELKLAAWCDGVKVRCAASVMIERDDSCEWRASRSLRCGTQRGIDCKRFTATQAPSSLRLHDCSTKPDTQCLTLLAAMLFHSDALLDPYEFHEHACKG